MLLKETALQLIQMSGAASVARLLTRTKLPILCYHGLWVTPGYSYGDRLFMSPQQFESRMRTLSAKYAVLPLDEALRLLRADALPPRAVVVTIDDGWATTYTQMVPILERYNIPTTLYVATSYVDQQAPVLHKVVDYVHERSGHKGRASIYSELDALSLDEATAVLKEYSLSLQVPLDWYERRQFHLMTAAEIRDAHHRGVAMELHTHNHTIENLDKEIDINRRILGEILSCDEGSFTHFCYPSGHCTPQSLDVLKEKNMASATLTEQGINASRADPLMLRRFLDGRSVSDRVFESYLAGVLDFTDRVLAMARGPR